MCKRRRGGGASNRRSLALSIGEREAKTTSIKEKRGLSRVPEINQRGGEPTLDGCSGLPFCSFFRFHYSCFTASQLVTCNSFSRHPFSPYACCCCPSFPSAYTAQMTHTITSASMESDQGLFTLVNTQGRNVYKKKMDECVGTTLFSRLVLIYTHRRTHASRGKEGKNRGSVSFRLFFRPFPSFPPLFFVCSAVLL